MGENEGKAPVAGPSGGAGQPEQQFDLNAEVKKKTPQNIRDHLLQQTFRVMPLSPEDFVNKHSSSSFDLPDLFAKFKKVCPDFEEDFVNSKQGRYCIGFCSEVIFQIGPMNRRLRKADKDRSWCLVLGKEPNLTYVFIATFKQDQTKLTKMENDGVLGLTIKQASLIAVEILCRLMKCLKDDGDFNEKLVLTPLAGAIFSRKDVPNIARALGWSVIDTLSIINRSCQSGSQYFPENAVSSEVAVVAAVIATRPLEKKTTRDNIIVKTLKQYMANHHNFDGTKMSLIATYANCGLPDGITAQSLIDMCTKKKMPEVDIADMRNYLRGAGFRQTLDPYNPANFLDLAAGGMQMPKTYPVSPKKSKSVVSKKGTKLMGTLSALLASDRMCTLIDVYGLCDEIDKYYPKHDALLKKLELCMHQHKLTAASDDEQVKEYNSRINALSKKYQAEVTAFKLPGMADPAASLELPDASGTEGAERYLTNVKGTLQVTEEDVEASDSVSNKGSDIASVATEHTDKDDTGSGYVDGVKQPKITSVANFFNNARTVVYTNRKTKFRGRTTPILRSDEYKEFVRSIPTQITAVWHVDDAHDFNLALFKAGFTGVKNPVSFRSQIFAGDPNVSRDVRLALGVSRMDVQRICEMVSQSSPDDKERVLKTIAAMLKKDLTWSSGE